MLPHAFTTDRFEAARRVHAQAKVPVDSINVPVPSGATVRHGSADTVIAGLRPPGQGGRALP